MEVHSSAGHGRIAIHTAATSFSVTPGGSASIPLFLHNQGDSEGFFELSVTGIPTPWVFMPSQVMRLASGEQREAPLTIQVPAFPHGRAGRYRLAIRAANQSAPLEAAEVECRLTVAAFEVQGRIGLLLPATEFPVVPGEVVTIPMLLINQGLEGDLFALAVEGIPTAWVYTTSASTPLSPGQEREVSLTIQPPRSVQAGAGRQPFKIQVMSQAVPGQMAEAQCILTIATFSEFSSELRPQRIEAGEPARVTVENRGNIQQALTVTHQSPDDALVFEPEPAQELRVPPGEVAMTEFTARPRSRPLFGGQVTYPFISRVQAANMEVQNLRGEIVGRALIPSWVLPAALALILIIACVSILFAVLGDGDRKARPTQPPAVEASPPAEQPGPTEPPQELPTQPPPEQPTEPPQEQPEEQPPAAEQLPVVPDEGATQSDSAHPCLLASSDVPLLMAGRRRG